ncbi:hypothetical protein LQ327_09015 [Actinomycetospora endophytica]|uniref:Uncharacterized protein n=1 Tax=Actinomycetospora endophytica TaxID=2291215 RepID=A0ABS8P6F7_9PSEU|nr:hypothetical protein [Actinomycetospora endophytica]MCD2193522.1 hypothetical protein [Actinomycetospora endophytica]
MYLTAERDDASILRAVVQRALYDDAEQRKHEVEATGKSVAQEVAKLLG